MRAILRAIAPRVYKDGHRRCNELGKRLVVRRPVNRFLDVGCGDGRLTMEFAEVVQPSELWGLELNEEMIEQCQQQGITCRPCDVNGEWQFDDGWFDLILSSQNIEHLHDTRHYLAECWRCLAPGGQLIVLTENLASWANVWSLVFGWQPFSTTSICDWHLGNPFIWHLDQPKPSQLEDFGCTSQSHIRVLAYCGLKDLLAKTGFGEIRAYTRGYFPLFGLLSDVLCTLDRRHGHFLIANARKAADAGSGA